MTDTERCDVCHKRHEPGDECPDPGEEGYVTREMLIDAFRRGDRVCLNCQGVWWNDGTLPVYCPDCRMAWERFGEDDLPTTEDAS